MCDIEQVLAGTLDMGTNVFDSVIVQTLYMNCPNDCQAGDSTETMRVVYRILESGEDRNLLKGNCFHSLSEVKLTFLKENLSDYFRRECTDIPRLKILLETSWRVKTPQEIYGRQLFCPHVLRGILSVDLGLRIVQPNNTQPNNWWLPIFNHRLSKYTFFKESISKRFS